MISKGLIAFLLMTVQAAALSLLSRLSGSVGSPGRFEGSGPGPGEVQEPRDPQDPQPRAAAIVGTSQLLCALPFKRDSWRRFPFPCRETRLNSGADIKRRCSPFAAGVPKRGIHSWTRSPASPRALAPSSGCSPSQQCHLLPHAALPQEPAWGRERAEGKASNSHLE